MCWKTTAEETPPSIPDGDYSAIVKNVEDLNGPHGPMARIAFVLVTDDEFDGRQVSGLAGKKLHARSKLGRWIAAMIGRAPEVGEEITIDDLLNRQCRVTVRPRFAENGSVFDNVVQVMPADSKED